MAGRRREASGTCRERTVPGRPAGRGLAPHVEFRGSRLQEISAEEAPHREAGKRCTETPFIGHECHVRGAGRDDALKHSPGARETSYVGRRVRVRAPVKNQYFRKSAILKDFMNI